MAGDFCHGHARMPISRPGRIFNWRMAPRPLHLGPITTLANFSRLLAGFGVSVVAAWIAFALALVLLFILTHHGTKP